MPSTEAQRTLVKSPPELWTELSDPVSLARHLGDVGEIRIARVEPETKVEWEAESASGTVELKPSGWGTKVTLTIAREAPKPVIDAPDPEQEREPEAELEVEPKLEVEAELQVEPELEVEPEPKRPRWFAKLFRRRRTQQPIPEAEPEPPADLGMRAQRVSPQSVELEPSPNLAAELAAELARLEATMAVQDTELLGAVLDRLGAAHHRPFSRG